ncbi:MAG: efflux RND transporter periplasmic adaptor subunit, partial [Bacteroidota bacterium]|nr:efflux RND transporter periplasmic adaptor subunit [Bacteroidota bacterium]
VEGAIMPQKTVFLDAVEGGVAEKIYVEDGNDVTAGDVLLTLSNSGLQLDYINRETQILELINQIDNARISLNQNQVAQQAQLAEIEYQLRIASRQYRQNKILYREMAISQNDYDQSLDDYEYLQRKKMLTQRSLRQDSMLTTAQIRQMDFSVSRMRQNLSMVKQNLQSLEVRAPVSGRLSAFTIERGQLVTKGQALGQVDVPDGAKVRARIDEHYIARIFTGQKATMEVENIFYELEVRKIFPQVQNGYFTADAYFTGSQPPGIKKGQSVNVRLPLSASAAALLIERGSFTESTGGAWAFVVDGSGTEAAKRNIKTGRQNPQHIEILEGLKEGDRVVTSSYTGYEDKEKLLLK